MTNQTGFNWDQLLSDFSEKFSAILSAFFHINFSKSFFRFFPTSVGFLQKSIESNILTFLLKCLPKRIYKKKTSIPIKFLTEYVQLEILPRKHSKTFRAIS